MIRRVYLASDHAGFEMKEAIQQMLLDAKFEVIDEGPDQKDPEDDYPDFIKPAMEQLLLHSDSVGIIFGGSGEGEAMMANRFKGIRAVAFYGGPDDIIRLSREHNDSNVLSIGARFVSIEEAKRVVTIWLDTPFSGAERHKRRIAKLDNF